MQDGDFPQICNSHYQRVGTVVASFGFMRQARRCGAPVGIGQAPLDRQVGELQIGFHDAHGIVLLHPKHPVDDDVFETTYRLGR